MKELGRIAAILVSVLVLACTSFIVQDMSPSGRVAAQLPTWTPVGVTITPLTPSPTPENPTSTFTPASPTSTFTPAPPTSTFTPKPPTQTFTPKPPTQTFTPIPPTFTFTPGPGSSVTPQPSETPQPGNPSQPGPAPNPSCRSSVEGYVLDAAGQRVTGATVTIAGASWSSGMMTDDNGHYGFGGLCAGTATVSAVLSDGRAIASATVSLTGNNAIQLDLKPGAASTAVPAATQAAQPMPTGTEAGMPTTGHAGWLLVGGAALGVLLLLTAGARRALTVHERARKGD